MGRRGRAAGRHSRAATRTVATLDRLTEDDRAALIKAAGLVRAAEAQGGKAMSLTEAVQSLTGAALQPDGTMMPVRNLPRDPLDNTAFGPLWPLFVQAINPPRPDTGQPEPRAWEYPQGFNLPGSGNRLIDWPVLRAASVDVDVIRRCIEIRKEDLAQLTGSWVISEDAVKEAQEADQSKPRDLVEAELRQKFAPEIKRLTKFWARPWITNGVRLRQWLNGVIEDHIVLDGVAVYPVCNAGGEVIAFRLVDASTIKLLINDDGERPQPPYPAFQQNIYGFPRGEYLADVVLRPDGTEDTAPGWTAAQLTYWRENVRTYTPYGMSAVEQALIAAALYLKRQGWMHDTYDTGSTPDTWLVPEASKFTQSNPDLAPTQRREYERAINDDLGGQTGKRRQIKIAYPGMNPVQMKFEAEQYKPEYDLYLVKMLIGFFGVTPDRFGLTEAKGLGATGQHERDAEVAEDSGVNPDARFLTDLIMELSVNYLSAPPELEWVFAKKKTEDAAAKDQILDTQVKSGRKTLNEARRANGETTFNFPEADMPAFYAATGPLYLEGGAEKQKAMDEAAVKLAQNPPAPGGPGSVGGTGGGGAGGPRPKPTGGPVRKSAEAEEWRAAQGIDAVDAEVRAFRRWDKALGDKAPVRPFRFEHAQPFDLTAAQFDLDPSHMAFEGYEWQADAPDVINKDWRAWNAANPLHPRGPHGRFVKLGNLVDALAEHSGPLSDLHENVFDEAVRRAHAGRHVRRGQSQLADDLESRGLLEELGGPGKDKGRLSVSEAGRQYLRRREEGGDATPQAPVTPIPPQHTPSGEPEPVSPALPEYVDSPATTTARDRQARIDQAHRLAQVAAEVEELHLNGADENLIRERAQRAAGNAPGGLGDADALASTIGSHGTRDEMLDAAHRWAAEHGLAREGVAGTYEPYDPTRHHAPSWVGPFQPGQPVLIARPGYSWTDPATGERMRLSKASVDEPYDLTQTGVILTPDQVRAHPAFMRPAGDPELNEAPLSRLRRNARGQRTEAERARVQESTPLAVPTPEAAHQDEVVPEPELIGGDVDLGPNLPPDPDVIDIGALRREVYAAYGREERNWPPDVRDHMREMERRNAERSMVEHKIRGLMPLAGEQVGQQRPRPPEPDVVEGTAEGDLVPEAPALTPRQQRDAARLERLAARRRAIGAGPERDLTAEAPPVVVHPTTSSGQPNDIPGTVEPMTTSVPEFRPAQLTTRQTSASTGPAPQAGAGARDIEGEVVGDRNLDVDVAGVRDRLATVGSREEAVRAIDSLGLRKPQLLQLARDLEIPVRASDRKDAIRDTIVALTTGRRLDSWAIFPRDTPVFPNSTIEARGERATPRTPDEQRRAVAAASAANLEAERRRERETAVADFQRAEQAYREKRINSAQYQEAEADFRGRLAYWEARGEPIELPSAPTPADAARARASALAEQQGAAGRAAAGVGVRQPGKRAQSRAQRVAAQDAAMQARGETGRGATVAEIKPASSSSSAVLRGGTWDAPAASLGETLRGRLAVVTSREDARRMISGMSVADLREAARDLSLPVTGNKGELQERIVERTVGARLNSEALRDQGSFTPGSAGRPAAPSAPDRRAELSAEFERLNAEAEELDMQINFAESDREQRRLIARREALDERMGDVNRQLDAEIKRNRRIVRDPRTRGILARELADLRTERERWATGGTPHAREQLIQIDHEIQVRERKLAEIDTGRYTPLGGD